MLVASNLSLPGEAGATGGRRVLLCTPTCSTRSCIISTLAKRILISPDIVTPTGEPPMTTPALASILPREMTEVRYRPLFVFSIDVAKPSIIGKTPGGERRVGEITGGRFEGERLKGKVLSGGSDWQVVRTDGTWELNVRFVMETDDGHLIGMTYRGLRHGPKDVIDAITRGDQVNPASYYFRVAPFFETASDKYGWLNNIVSVGLGHRLPTGPIYQVFEIL
jgi:hypothetical protein